MMQCFYSYDPDKTDMNFRLFSNGVKAVFAQEESKPWYQHACFIS